ncbi:MAG TPA: glycosyltransferase family 39 protein, partial [Myxococcota bacterium]|nr:glycosyltransferase family 39 protein [Myxococcota bacterium]
APRLRGLVAPGAVLALCAALALYGLDRPKLWMDEAETALLARSVLVHGIPEARIGDDLISQEVGREFGPDLVWRWTPWLDKYVAAGAFALFGEGTLAARLPFALLGLAAVASVHRLAWGLFGDRRVALLSMAFLGTSVPFLLHVRQCRYYVLAILGTLWAVHFAAATVRRRGAGAVVGLAAALTLVFQANYLSFAALAAALATSLWLLRVDRSGWRRLLVAAALVALLAAPWIVYFDIVGKVLEEGGGSRGALLDQVADYAALTARYGFPVAALPPFAVVVAAAPRRREALSEWRTALFLALVAAVYLLAISATPWVFYRYTVNLLPIFAVLLAWLSVTAWSLQRVAGAVFAGLLLVTGVFSEISALPTRYAGDFHPGRTIRAFDWAFPLGNEVSELLHPFEGATGTMTKYIAANGHRGDRVFATYGDLTARFYLPGFEVRGGQSGERLAGWGPPEWVLVRRFFRFNDDPNDVQAMLDWLNHEVPLREYEQIELPLPDLAWESIPEPQLHFFRPPTEGKRATILWRPRR